MPGDFRLYKHLDVAIEATESRQPQPSQSPSVWPSEASAVRLNRSNSASLIVGTCHRASFLRMIGATITNKVDATGAWRFVIGRNIETHMGVLARASNPNIYIASGVRYYIPELYLPLEIDLVVRDPESNQGWIVECKSHYGYMSAAELDKVGPKLEHIMQICMYLQQVPTGARLKEVIQQSLRDKANGVARNRIDVCGENLALLADGQLGGKLAYLARDEGDRREFTISIQQDFDGSHYPVVDGQMWKVFTLESIWERYRTLQDYWLAARREAYQRLQSRGIHPPEGMQLILNRGDVAEKRPESREEDGKYLDQLAQEVLKLPSSFWPPAEYEWSYSQEKIEDLYGKKLISKAKYDAWKKKKVGKDKIGDWQCGYCKFKHHCIPLVYPQWKYQVYDIMNMKMEELEVER